MKSRILVVARDADLRATLARWLIAAGHAVELAESARRAREAAASEELGLALVAPDELAELGTDPARELGDPAGGLIIIGRDPTASGSATTAHIELPLDQDAVLRQVSAALRPPAETSPGLPEVLRFEGHTLDAAGRTCVDADGRELTLTRAEFTLLLTLARQAGRVVSRDALRQAVVGRDAGPDDRSVDMLISRLRRKIESDAREPRIVVTVPGEGYKFTPQSVTAAPKPVPTVVPAEARDGTISPPAAGARRRFAAAPVAALAGGLAIVVAGLVWFAQRKPESAATTATIARFDGTVIPFIDDATRKRLSEDYPKLPEHKALVIWANGWTMVSASATPAVAVAHVLEECARMTKRPHPCDIYAVDMDVTWPARSPPMPLPADLHAEQLGEPFDPKQLPAVSDQTRRFFTLAYSKGGFHKAAAIALGTQQGFTNSAKASRSEAVRLAIEKCGELNATPCLLMAVDGQWTLRIPKSHRVVALFMLTTEPGLSDDERKRIDEVYRGNEWRALAHGGSGGWYPVANAPSEAAAVEAALAACTPHESGCRVHAIGNFRVADQ
jgi:DNA-binding response OmpR family regulator